MKILYTKLIGYAGFYHGMGLTTLEVDFTRSKFPITLISGPNACGKSTLLNALSLIPDPNDCFEPGMNASKYLKIFDNGTIYEIFMNHPVDSKGNRAVTKISIMKDGIELNPNGNVSSYKDIIYNEFDLDSNYITLSYLSGTDRGLADKRPGERKKFITNIVSSLEVYNDINKTLNKKSNVYKSQLNALGTKINNLGDANMLASTQVSLLTRQKKLTENIEILKARIVENNTKISMQDPDGKIRSRFDELNKIIQDLKLKIDVIQNSIRNVRKNILEDGSGIITIDKIDQKLSEYQNGIDIHNKIIQESDTEEKIMIAKISDAQGEVTKLKIKLDKLSNDINPDIETELGNINKEISDIREEFNKFNLGNIDNITKDEITQAIDAVNSIMVNIEAIYHNIGIIDLPEFVSECGHISSNIDNIISEIDKIKSEDEVYKAELVELNSDYNIISGLVNRPESCKIDSCYFISKAVNTLKKYGKVEDLEAQINRLDCLLSENRKNKLVLNEKLQKYRNMLSSEALLGSITTIAKSNHAILSKIRIFTLLIDESTLLRNISNGYTFNEYKNLSELLNISNDLIRYKSLLNIQKNLESEYKINRDKINSYKELQQEMDTMNNDIDNSKETLIHIRNNKEFEESIIREYKQKQEELINFKDLFNSYLDLKKELEESISEMDDIKRSFTSSEQYMIQITEDNNKIREYNMELEPLSNELKTIDTHLTLLDQYNREYNEIQEKYIIIDKLKKYSSPVSGGIQTLFMNLYMSKTLDLANQLLGMIFGGQFQLADYVINQDEFRIPFTGRGLMVDDISSGSTSQICIMGMIINLVLLHQASSKFNITRLDEIDGGLDHQNRYMFVDILQKIVGILQIDQLFIISHSVESALSNVDVIQLAPMPDEESFVGANIIYSYKDRV